MKLTEALSKIKSLRDEINDHVMPADGSGDWVNPVIEKLDQASDIIEFPNETASKIWK